MTFHHDLSLLGLCLFGLLVCFLFEIVGMCSWANLMFFHGACDVELTFCAFIRYEGFLKGEICVHFSL